MSVNLGRLSGRVGENAVFRSHVMRNLDALNAAVLMTTRVAVVFPTPSFSASLKVTCLRALDPPFNTGEKAQPT